MDASLATTLSRRWEAPHAVSIRATSTPAKGAKRSGGSPSARAGSSGSPSGLGRSSLKPLERRTPLMEMARARTTSVAFGFGQSRRLQEGIPPSTIPRQYHIVEVAVAPPDTEVFEARYRTADGQWQVTVFPAKKPTSRQDTHMLHHWISLMEDKVKLERDFDKSAKQIMFIYTSALSEIARQIWTRSKDQAALLLDTSAKITALMDVLLQHAASLTKQATEAEARVSADDITIRKLTQEIQQLRELVSGKQASFMDYVKEKQKSDDRINELEADIVRLRERLFRAEMVAQHALERRGGLNSDKASLSLDVEAIKMSRLPSFQLPSPGHTNSDADASSLPRSARSIPSARSDVDGAAQAQVHAMPKFQDSPSSPAPPALVVDMIDPPDGGPGATKDNDEPEQVSARATVEPADLAVPSPDDDGMSQASMFSDSDDDDAPIDIYTEKVKAENAVATDSPRSVVTDASGASGASGTKSGLRWSILRDVVVAADESRDTIDEDEDDDAETARRKTLKKMRKRKKMGASRSTIKAYCPPSFSKLVSEAGQRQDIRMRSQLWVCKKISQVYAGKIFQDECDDRENNPRSSLQKFLFDFYSKQYGLRNLSELHLLELLTAVERYKESNAQIRLFHRFCIGEEGDDLTLQGLNLFLKALGLMVQSNEGEAYAGTPIPPRGIMKKGVTFQLLTKIQNVVRSLFRSDDADALCHLLDKLSVVIEVGPRGSRVPCSVCDMDMCLEIIVDQLLAQARRG